MSTVCENWLLVVRCGANISTLVTYHLFLAVILKFRTLSFRIETFLSSRSVIYKPVLIVNIAEILVT
jgi:hypothetical protein